MERKGMNETYCREKECKREKGRIENKAQVRTGERSGMEWRGMKRTVEKRKMGQREGRREDR